MLEVDKGTHIYYIKLILIFVHPTDYLDYIVVFCINDNLYSQRAAEQ